MGGVEGTRAGRILERKPKELAITKGEGGKKEDQGPGLRRDRYWSWSPGRSPRAPLPSLPGRGDYNSQHRPLRPREGEKKKV